MGIFDVQTYSKTQIDAKYETRNSRNKVVPIATRNASLGGASGTSLSNGTNMGSNFRVQHKVLVAATGIQFIYANYRSYDTQPAIAPNPITVTAGVTLNGTGDTTTTIAPVTFGGKSSVTIDPGGYAYSDILPFDVVPGDLLYSRTYVSVATSGQKWPVALSAHTSFSETVDRSATPTDLSKSGTITNANGNGYSPFLIVGRPSAASGRKPVVALVGDSILFGIGENTGSDIGFATPVLEDAGILHMNLAAQGEQARSWASPFSTYVRSAFLDSATHAIHQHGINDLSAGRTLAVLQVDIIKVWKRLAARGLITYRTTLTPYTTSTDGWTTVANQSVAALEPVRVAFNDWLRDGAPLTADATAAVATGTSGALRMGTVGHPIAGLFDVADTVETARNSGKWIANGTASFYTVDGVHPRDGARTLMKAAVNASVFAF